MQKSNIFQVSQTVGIINGFVIRTYVHWSNSSNYAVKLLFSNRLLMYTCDKIEFAHFSCLFETVSVNYRVFERAMKIHEHRESSFMKVSFLNE